MVQELGGVKTKEEPKQSAVSHEATTNKTERLATETTAGKLEQTADKLEAQNGKPMDAAALHEREQLLVEAKGVLEGATAYFHTGPTEKVMQRNIATIDDRESARYLASSERLLVSRERFDNETQLQLAAVMGQFEKIVRDLPEVDAARFQMLRVRHTDADLARMLLGVLELHAVGRADEVFRSEPHAGEWLVANSNTLPDILRQMFAYERTQQHGPDAHFLIDHLIATDQGQEQLATILRHRTTDTDAAVAA